MIDLGLSLIAVRLVAFGFAKHAFSEVTAAKARYETALAAAQKQYPKTAHELGELALVRAASASWVIKRLADAAEARSLLDHHRAVKILGGRSLEHARKRLDEARRFRVQMDFPATSPLTDMVGLAILTRRLDRFGLVPIPALHYPIDRLIADMPFGDVIVDVASALHVHTVGDLLGDALLIWGIKRTIDMLVSVGRYYEMARRYRDEAVRLEAFTRQMVEMEASARTLRLDHPGYCTEVLRWIIVSQEGERLGSVLVPSDARWIASELARAAKAYMDHLEAPVAGAEDSAACPSAVLSGPRLRLADFAPHAIVAHLKEAVRFIREGKAHQRAARVEEVRAAEIMQNIPLLEPILRREVGNLLARRATAKWAA